MIQFLLITLVEGSFVFNDQTAFYKEKVPTVNLYSETGYIGVDDPSGSNNQMFYHLFLKDGTTSLANVKEDDTLILWLNGGPGCSSMMHIFANVGPYNLKRVGENLELSKSEHSWSQVAHVLFVDQPLGVGFSYTTQKEPVKTSLEGSRYMIDFLEIFFDNRPQFIKNKFYIFGVSYGGHYVPSLVAELFEAQLDKKVNFQGMGVGNGWTNPMIQFGNYGQLLYQVGVVDQLRRETEKYSEATDLGFKGIFYMMYYQAGKVSPYDFQQYVDLDHLDEDISAAFLNMYKDKYGVPKDIKYETCSKIIGDAFHDDITHNQAPNVDIALSKRRVLIYNGNLDLICNTAGTNAWVNQLKWDKLFEWKKQPKIIWKSINPQTGVMEPAGTIKKYDNLYYATVYRAGHMTPQDQPEASLRMLQHFLNDDNWE